MTCNSLTPYWASAAFSPLAIAARLRSSRPVRSPSRTLNSSFPVAGRSGADGRMGEGESRRGKEGEAGGSAITVPGHYRDQARTRAMRVAP